MRWPFSTLFALVFFLGPLRDAGAEAGDELTISLLTFGPGDHPFSKFGHNGLLVENAVLRTTVVYNYGTFSFQSIDLIPKFLLGKYRYWLSVQSLDSTLATYTAENRSVVAQRLRLDPEQKRAMVAFLAFNARDENKYYLFDYYRDNCATRIRDLIDRATKGALARVSSHPAEMSWRGHTERLTADDLPVYLGLYVAMGNVIDRPITQWEEMFLPAKLAEGIARADLVDRETVLARDRRPAPRASPPSWTGRAAAAGTVGAALVGVLGHFAARGRRAARVGLGVALGMLGSLFGLFGCLFLFLWIFTNHEVAYHNENILQLAPFALLLPGAGVGVAKNRPGAATRASRLALAALASSALGIALKVLPWFSQDNILVIAFALPLWAGAAASTHLVAGAIHKK